MRTVRPPAVAGLFYPEEPRALAETVDGFLAAAPILEASVPRGPKALVVPHAGYVYSGAIAGLAYGTLALNADRISRVVLLGPCHRVAARGLALPGYDRFATPLGEVPIEAPAALDHVVTRADVHALEHSLEVQVPFLQRALGDFTLVPLAVGEASPDEVADVLEALWGGEETLIVVSTDLSHYHPDAQARAIDAATIEAVAAGSPLTHRQACGATPLNGLLLAARRHRLIPVLLGATNSGDTAGDRARVVGYASWAWVEAA